MHVSVDFQDESLELELPDEQVVVAWRGPEGQLGSGSAELIQAALEAPREFPPLRQTVVPGDRVTIALDPTIPEAGLLLGAITRTIQQAGIEAGGLTVLLTSGSRGALEQALPQDVTLAVHDPDDPAQIAYLATTKQGRRIYLNRHLTDAEVVVPVGRIAFDPILGYSGPWSVLFPGLADRETMNEHRSRFRVDTEGHQEKAMRSVRDESFEVSWLLGTQLHVGVVPAARGCGELIAGRDSVVCEQGIAWVDEHWTVRSDSRSEIVVVGIGGPGDETSLEDLAQGLSTATSLVQHGGKIVVLSRATGSVGPALRCLIDAAESERGKSLLRGHERDQDFQVAARIAQAVAWADVFLLSGLARDLVEELSMVPIEKPEQARRLVSQGRSAAFVSRADRARAIVQDDD